MTPLDCFAAMGRTVPTPSSADEKITQAVQADTLNCRDENAQPWCRAQGNGCRCARPC